MLDSASIVSLWVSLTSVSALLLDEYSFQGGSGATICDHDLLRVIEHLGVIHSTWARVLLTVLSCRDVVVLSVVAHCLGLLTLDADFVVGYTRTFYWWGHRTILFILTLHWPRTTFSFECSSVCISRRLINTFEVVWWSLVSELASIVVSVWEALWRMANPHDVIGVHMLRLLVTVHPWQLECLVWLAHSFGWHV